jgi:hypothetical protein
VPSKQQESNSSAHQTMVLASDCDHPDKEQGAVQGAIKTHLI